MSGILQRKKTCKQATCGVKTIHRVVFTEDGLRRVWECTNCGHQTPIRYLTESDVRKLAKA